VELIDETVVDTYGTGTWLLLDELVVVVVVGPWYCEGTSLLDKLNIIELETIELDIDDETELEIGDCTALLLLVDP
jgi:hypothetical protein